MARIYRLTDRVKVKIDDVVVVLRPLNLHQKNEIRVLFQKHQNSKDLNSDNGLDNSTYGMQGILQTIKYTVDSVQGFVIDDDGTEYKVEKDQQGYLTDDCVNELLSSNLQQKIIAVCNNSLLQLPDENTLNEDVIPGVQIIRDEKKSPKKKD